MDFQYPGEVVKTMKPQIINLRLAVRTHYERRHVNGNKPVRNWIGDLRRIMRNSGYNKAARQLKESGVPIYVYRKCQLNENGD